MKRVLLTLLVATFCPRLHAQLAMEGGLNMANMTLKSMGNSINTTYRQAANMGLSVDLAMSSHIYFEPGVFYEMGGCKLTTVPAAQVYLGITDVLFFLEYKSGEKCGSRFMIGGGPYIGYNMNGFFHYDSYKGLPDSTRILTIGQDKTSDLLSRGFGFGLNVGYMFNKHVYIKARYLSGVTNLYPLGDPKNKMTTSSIAINLGYLFCNCRNGDGGGIFRREKSNHWHGLRKNKYSRKQIFFRGQ